MNFIETNIINPLDPYPLLPSFQKTFILSIFLITTHLHTYAG